MYIYIYMFLYIRVYIYIHLYVHMHIHVYTYLYISIQTLNDYKINDIVYLACHDERVRVFRAVNMHTEKKS